MAPGDEGLKKPTVMPQPGGPLLYDNPLHPDSGVISDPDGERIRCGRKAALCRCGGSLEKPFCDGTHAKIGFSDANKADRSRDRRRSYEGKRITIHDNRCACSHAKHCVQELPQIFRSGERPWIDPDAAEPEEIIRVIEKCPSGALSYSIDGVEHRDLDREPGITVSRHGPYCLVGGIEVRCEEPRPDRVSTEHATLCRCGASANMPFCDGSHEEVDFED